MDIKPRHLAARVFHLREGDIVEIVFIQTCLLRAATGVKPEVLRRYLGLGARRKGSQGTKAFLQLQSMRGEKRARPSARPL